MAISDIAEKVTPSDWQTCATCALLDRLPESERAALVGLLSDPSVRYGWLAEQLVAEGHPIDWQPLSRHARGKCAAKAKLR